MLKQNLQMREKELEKVKNEAAKTEKDLISDLEHQRKTDEQRYNNLLT